MKTPVFSVHFRNSQGKVCSSQSVHGNMALWIDCVTVRLHSDKVYILWNEIIIFCFVLLTLLTKHYWKSWQTNEETSKPSLNSKLLHAAYLDFTWGFWKQKNWNFKKVIQEEVYILFRLQNCSWAITMGPTPCLEPLMAFFQFMSIFLPCVYIFKSCLSHSDPILGSEMSFVSSLLSCDWI